MHNLKDLEVNSHPQGRLHREEIQVLLEVIDFIVGKYTDGPLKGSCILDTQAKQQAAQCAFRFSLAEGEYRRQFFGLHDRTSSEIAKESINEILAYPEHSSRYDAILQFGAKRAIRSGVYRNGELKVLVLNAQNERYLFTFHVQEADLLNAVVYYAVAEALMLMKGTVERNLPSSALQVLAAVILKEGEYYEAVMTVMTEVRAMLQDRTLPAIQKWHEWQLLGAQK